MGSCLSKKKPNSTTPSAASEVPRVEEAVELIKEDVNLYYVSKKVIGTGNFSSVKLAKRINGDSSIKYAIKFCPKRKLNNDLTLLKREIAVLQKADHPNITKCFEVFEDPLNINIVMEHCKGGEYFDRIAKKVKMTEAEAAWVLFRVFHAISHIHALGYCHRDLKPENFLFETDRPSSEIKVADFGLAVNISSGQPMQSVVGTPNYLAPEIIRENYGVEVDNWSLGVILFVTLSGKTPFSGSTQEETFKQIMKGSVNLSTPEWRSISADAKDLVKRLLNVDAKRRMTAAEALSHRWFQTNVDLLAMEHDMQFAERLLAFRPANLFKLEGLKLLVKQVPSNSIQPLTNSYRILDTDFSGCITPPKLVAGLERVGKQVSIEDAQRKEYIGLVSSLDQARRGYFCYTQFLMAAADTSLLTSRPYLWTSFKHFDRVRTT
jgi:calcium-dependent protein kinase